MSTAFVRPERSQSSRRSSASLPKSSGTASQQRGTAAGRDNGRGDRSRSRDASSHAAPRRLARTEREAEILEAAFTEFAARGYAATRLEDVARRAGVAKGLPHFYFERKEDLFRAVLRRFIVPPWVDLIETAAAAEGPTRDVLRATLALMYERLAVNERYREVIPSAANSAPALS